MKHWFIYIYEKDILKFTCVCVCVYVCVCGGGVRVAVKRRLVDCILLETVYWNEKCKEGVKKRF